MLFIIDRSKEWITKKGLWEEGKRIMWFDDDKVI